MIRLFFFLLTAFSAPIAPLAQVQPFQNPILAGFHPDPSICRVEDDYYLITSSFEWFPGIPIYHSKDLINWQQMGHVLDRPSQLAITDRIGIWGGIWAPTIRFHEGTFYVITTLQPGNTIFYVTATDPKGPWSDPVIIEDAPGIDPSLFFDEDGKVWVLGSFSPEEERWQSENRIYIQEINLSEGRLLGERIEITSGHATNAKFCQGPRLYKYLNQYILLTAEGGTWNDHAVTAFMADAVTGPFQPLPINPVLTHRHLGRQAPITSVGHADLVETQNGEWWAVVMGIRPISGVQHFLGRETFLTPVEWQGFTPIFNPGKGMVLPKEQSPDLPWSPVVSLPERDDFTQAPLRLCYNFFHTPLRQWWQLDTETGNLNLELQAKRTTDNTDFSLVARRQETYHFEASTLLSFEPRQNQEAAGLFFGQHCQAHFRLEVIQVDDQQKIQLIKVYRNARRQQKEELLADHAFPGGAVQLSIEGRGQNVQFFYSLEGGRPVPLGELQDALFLSSRIAGGFTGNYIGMFASSNGRSSENTAQFDWFLYRNKPLESKR